MRERPVIFDADSVRAILDGRKSQTRRIINPQPDLPDARGPEVDAAWASGFVDVRCPVGVPGDRLWVREAWQVSKSEAIQPADCIYRADGVSLPHDWMTWHSPVHMPRWASRLLLEVTEVRVQRLQEISEADAQAEGMEPLELTEADIAECTSESIEDRLARALGAGSFSHKVTFEMAWNEINGKRAPWSSNPFVWAISFRKVEP